MPDVRPTEVPEEIKEAAMVARVLGRKSPRTRDEEEALNQARLKVAFWACRQEGVYASWENLQYVLGAHAEAIQPAYERLQSDRADQDRLKTAKKRAAETGIFWGGADGPSDPSATESKRK